MNKYKDEFMKSNPEAICETTVYSDWLEKRLEQAEGDRERLADDIQNARDWLLPGREILVVDVTSCIEALDEVIKNLRSPTPGTETPYQER